MTDESYIKLALEIAKKGRGNVSPNPMVGAILVKNEKIIGAGFHEHFGGNHAEINAIQNAKQDVAGSTLYVNLEPCSHYGKTPPCTEAIIKNKIKKVVIGTLDMNPLVSGSGIRALKDAGIEVKVGVLENECVALNKFFFKHISKQLPYVTLKVAQTLDGRIADLSGDSKWITSLNSRRYVHDLRSQYDAVLVGTKTVKIDDPNLTVRFIEGRNPKRVVVDSSLKLNLKLKLFVNNIDGNLLLLTSRKSADKKRKLEKLKALGVEVLFVKENKDGTLNLKHALEELGKNKISSVLVEGGRKIYTSFIKEGLFDDMVVFISPKIIGEGLPAVDKLGIHSIRKSMKLRVRTVEKLGEDVLIELTK
ncbi:MAG: bifunctional diaminohydroxyphosphoribosylaminopyrimidine deaminase/5-amino-6-(5-phosphoribosylamino)uracil reductase RibD [Bacteroidota bacterium]|nr:bifunctional diaminohydroxyphosphoribosylaminopyrimidine deaminase/5-amino-6-(5-phosphoribosylamino)uracil reductase RibD [Ignavibacteria bacterium]MCU7499891.1 bifunctional diaminohydroxyphosphoribosylaminopyrimidine deaminase/5-amino-6-(5-phosphoribosylamino)uracil reductase RibD [Ignavibacteria bacterium]MCU7513813.1 bifunctional diaminohydroxyphosphoribosylaminopyrimidine deaminase/5-amino-6-(5-phosphoribosylamino)uracil reductase RibD [Ignavibacteria bacterium]MCU7522344.1 bifunctional d